MKTSNQCIKCQGTHIVKIVPPRGHVGSNDIKTNIFNVIRPTRYMCANCGYSEEWIDDYIDVDKIVKKYKLRDPGSEFV